ncbi:hypothetical protein ACOSQ3_016964 [Xanthoceras sorbifolium]
MCYFASLTTEGYQRAKLAIDSLCTKMQLLIQEWKDMSHDRMSDHIKDPPAVTTRDALRLLPDPVTHRYCPLWVLYGVGPHGFLSPPSSGFEPGLVLMDKYQVRILMREAKESREGRRRRAPKADSTLTAKGLVRRTNKTGAKLCNCGRYRQPGHIAKTCQANIQKGASVIGSNEGGQTSGTTPTIGVPPNTFEFPYNESSATNYAHMTNDDVHYRNDGQGHMYEQYNPWWFPPNRL